MKNNVIFWALTVLFLVVCTVLFFSRNSAENQVYCGTESVATSEAAQTAEEILLININTADKDELMLLTGIGEITAENIIAHRNEKGNFLTIEEIMEVSGIGEKKFEAIKNYITVGD